MSDRTIFDELIAASADLDRRARRVQGDKDVLVDDDDLDRLVADYHEWYANALAALPVELHDQFRDLFEGGLVIKRIRAFLENPGMVNPFFDEEQQSGLIDRWQHPFETTFHSSLLEQRQLLAEAKHLVKSAASSENLALIERICRGFPALSHAVAHRHASRPALLIGDEYDVQDLLGGILRMLFQDVREEDPAPTRAGGSSRVDFLLKREQVVVEVKMTRAGLKDRQVGDQLIQDVERYRAHPECGALVAFVYDPDRHIVNARGLEDDLAGERSGLIVRVVVVQ
ncbi:hypothetical protein LRS13_13760 [Svornostia abyssi]|uniref:Uncharacterized protein n=1 Tax=Svornostia abyssi TaxID=2898438 RepID=A0ABY5PBG3_9ACTN|nr:hypothetical protein LRS13_13760 [Parviterribacteraceae bacterium J379]